MLKPTEVCGVAARPRSSHGWLRHVVAFWSCLTEMPWLAVNLETPVEQDGATFQGWVLMRQEGRRTVYKNATPEEIACARHDWAIR